jgi:hypothetical protein
MTNRGEYTLLQQVEDTTGTEEYDMPDGDIVHPSVSPRFQQLYVQVCQGELAEDDLVRKALGRLIKEVEFFGDEPLHLIAQEEALFQDIFLRRQQGKEINWAHERRKLKQLQQSADGHQRALGLMVRACEDQLRELEQHGYFYIAPPDFQREITRQYLINVYDAQFAEPAATPLRPHPHQADPDFVRQRLIAIRPDVIKGLGSYVEHILRHGTIEGMRRPPSSPMRKINLEEDAEKDISELLR